MRRVLCGLPFSRLFCGLDFWASRGVLFLFFFLSLFTSSRAVLSAFQVARDKPVGACSAVRLNVFVLEPAVLGLLAALWRRKSPEAAVLRDPAKLAACSTRRHIRRKVHITIDIVACFFSHK